MSENSQFKLSRMKRANQSARTSVQPADDAGNQLPTEEPAGQQAASLAESPGNESLELQAQQALERGATTENAPSQRVTTKGAQAELGSEIRLRAEQPGRGTGRRNRKTSATWCMSTTSRIKQGDIHIAVLQRMSMPQLIEQARSENLTDYMGIKSRT